MGDSLDDVHSFVRPHVESFDWLLSSGLDLIVKNLHAVEIPADPETDRPTVRLSIKKIHIGCPVKNDDVADGRLYPNECREGRRSYTGPLLVTVQREVNGGAPIDLQVRCGDAPVMVKSTGCHLRNLSEAALIARREEGTEMGGYFIVNGLEKVMRLLILPKRNYISALIRPSFTNRGADYTEYATAIRCVREDQTSQTVTVHYVNDGTCTVRLTIGKQEFLTPIVLIFHALHETTDFEIFQSICADDDSFAADRVERMLRDMKALNLGTQCDYLSYLGSRFRFVLKLNDDISNADAGRILLDRHFLIHCNDNLEKFDVLTLMVKKLFALVSGQIQMENADALSAHEALLPGHLYGNLLKERCQEMLYFMKFKLMRDFTNKVAKFSLSDEVYLRSTVASVCDIGQRLHYLLSTGNLVSASGLDLMQISGYTIIAEKLNFYRYLAHFKSIHRGAFFAEMKTTTVRKLLPECFGFLCPVHTPDGSPCGLLNHLAAPCKILCLSPDAPMNVDLFLDTLTTLGMSLPRRVQRRNIPHGDLAVLFDGVVVGFVAVALVAQFTQRLRFLKVTAPRIHSIPSTLEITVVPTIEAGAYPGIFLASNLGRFIRPVTYLPTQQTEWISPLEQVFLDIAIRKEDVRVRSTLHMEIDPINMLSVIASLTPFSDFNQSPRNMYQCQMGKQTMGTPYHSHAHRPDNKIYRIQNVQTPAVRNAPYSELDMDRYPLGCNAVVAVISYTGYDMEDAMIINKSAFERGFGHGSVYTTKIVDLSDLKVGRDKSPWSFGNKDVVTGKKRTSQLGLDGLPVVGAYLQTGDPLYAIFNANTQEIKVVKHKSNESAYVEQVRVLGSTSSDTPMTISITMRYNRNAVLGDKFSSRHGQKGVLSQLWNQIDMPFTGDGLTPDIIINPHAFPSRMTIGMLIESMAGKAACMHGVFGNGTPFKFNENDLAIDYFGEQLRSSGFNFVGNEEMFSGVSGLQFEADVFIGVVYYQRLRHMVSDKSQVRSTGPTNELTHQPVKGRKRKGGIRFGEMERDSLLGHGAAFLLNDRLLKCSDAHPVHVCKLCGSILSLVANKETRANTCLVCKASSACTRITVPYVFTYLVCELAAMNIKVKLNVK